MPSRILKKNYKSKLERDIDALVELGVIYHDEYGRHLTRDQIREIFDAARIEDEGQSRKKIGKWALENFPEVFDIMAEEELQKTYVGELSDWDKENT